MAYKERKFICLHCKQAFFRKAKKATYCSKTCQVKHSHPGLNFHPKRSEILEEKIFKCEECGEPFIAKINKKRKFCSNECNRKHLQQENKITGRPSTRKVIKKRCEYCNKEIETKIKNRRFCSNICWYMSEECRTKVSSNPTIYNGITFRSSWEAIIAEYLDKAQFEYEYEKHKFYLNKELGHYIPDFYIPEKDVFIEVKGRWLYDAKIKVDTFRKKYKKKLYVIESISSLSIMMMLQYLYGLSHYDFDSNDEDYIENKIKYTCMLMIDEIIEVLRETNYKEHKNKKVVDREHLVEEVIDVFIFLLNLMLLLKVDYKEFEHTFKQKYTLNRFRILFPKIKFNSIATFLDDIKKI